MTKTLHKAMMLRSQLKNKFIKSLNNEVWFNYKKQPWPAIFTIGHGNIEGRETT